MPNNVLFRIGTWEQYNGLAAKDPGTLYFITDATHQEIWKGAELFARGTEVTDTLAGLMTPEQKRALESLVESSGQTVELPTYELEMQPTPESGAVATYKLKKTVGTTSTYAGCAINIPTDKVLTGGSLAYAPEANIPYTGAAKGDPYLDLVLNDASASHIYIPVKGLVDVPSAGDGISVISNIVSIKIDAANAHGLVATANGLALGLASVTTDGAMSSADKQALDAIAGLKPVDSSIVIGTDAVDGKKTIGVAISAETGNTLTLKPDGLFVEVPAAIIPNAEQFTTSDDGVFTISSVDTDVVTHDGKKLSEVLDEHSESLVWGELTDTITVSGSASTAVANASDGATIIVNNDIAEAVTVEKSATIQGANVGVAQNYAQEV